MSWHSIVRKGKTSLIRLRGLQHQLTGRFSRPDLLGTPETPLIAAARRGHVVTVERILLQGANPDEKDTRGRTALHDAVSCGHTETAACLLTYGASPGIADDQDRYPLDVDLIGPQALHAIRQRYHRYRAQAHTTVSSGSALAETLAREIDRRGIAKVSGLIEPNRLARLREEFKTFVENLQNKLAEGRGVYRNYDEEEHLWAKDLAYVCNNAFKYSQELVRLCCNETLLETANIYIGKPAFIQRGIAMRYLPNRSTTNDMFGWHHDMEDKRCKMMILLTDLGGSDQHMSYVPGSHKLFHPYEMFFENRCSLGYCRKKMHEIEIYDAVGRAGDIFLFDSNGAHRGNRKEAASVRDVFIVEYSADPSQIWGGDVDRSLIDHIRLRGHNPFQRLLTVEKTWQRPFTRKFPTWVENLPHVDRWLGPPANVSVPRRSH